jgi:hypothetical protein
MSARDLTVAATASIAAMESALVMQAVWLVIGTESALERLEPLVQAHRVTRAVRALALPHDQVLRFAGLRPGPSAGRTRGRKEPAPRAWLDALDQAAAVLVVGERRHSPRNVLPGLFLHDRSGRRVPVGWVPDVPERLSVFARAAARVVARVGAGLPRGPLVLLGQWEDRTLRLATQTQRGFVDVPQPLPVFRWTGERIVRPNLLQALRCGPGLAIYFGHGRPRGWAGYHGLRAHHLADALEEPLGAVLSLTCHTANRFKVGLSFAEEMVLSGFCAGALGATRKTVHLSNGFLAHKLCRAVSATAVASLAELLLAAELTEAEAHGSYRIIGDPLAPLIGAPDSLRRAQAVFAPAPDDPLPPLEQLE